MPHRYHFYTVADMISPPLTAAKPTFYFSCYFIHICLILHLKQFLTRPDKICGWQLCFRLSTSASMLIYSHIFIINSENNILDAFACCLYTHTERKASYLSCMGRANACFSQHSEQLKDALYVADVGKLSLMIN